MQHAWYADVVDVSAITKRKSFCFVLNRAASDATWFDHDRNFTASDHLDRIKNFYVSSATTQVGTKMFCHVAAHEVSALFVDLSFSPDHYARYAKTTLQTTTSRKCLSVGIAFGLRYSFKSDNG